MICRDEHQGNLSVLFFLSKLSTIICLRAKCLFFSVRFQSDDKSMHHP